MLGSINYDRNSIFDFVTLVRITVAALLLSPESSAEIFKKSPESVNAVDGQTVVFTCTAIADDFFFYVNETTADQQSVIDKGFIQGQIDSSTRTLTTVASTMYNSTRITCAALNFSFPAVSSDPPATLLVQGLLAAVVDLSYSFIDSSTVNISWSPPFTLPGTDITGYNISVASNGTTTNYFTSDSYYELLLTDITDSPCNEIFITVSGYNGLDGENRSIDLIMIPPVFISVLNESSINLVYFSVDVDTSSLCPGQLPTHINLTIQQYNRSLVATHYNIPLQYLSTDSTILTTNDLISVDSDNQYAVIVTLAGVFTYLYNKTILFSTYALQSVSLLPSTGPFIEFVCEFSPALSAQGCVIRLSVNGTVQYESSGSRTINNTAVVSFCGVVEGVYELSAFDIDDSIQPSLTTTAAVQIEQLKLTTIAINTITQCPTTTVYTSTSTIVFTTISSDSTISATPLPTSGLPLTIIGAAVGGGVLLLFICVIIILAASLLMCRACVSRSKRTDNVDNDYCPSTHSEICLLDEQKYNVVAPMANEPQVYMYDDVASVMNKPKPQHYDDVVTAVHKTQEYDDIQVSAKLATKKQVTENSKRTNQNTIVYAELNSMDNFPKARLQDGQFVMYSELQPHRGPPRLPPRINNNVSPSNEESTSLSSTSELVPSSRL